MSGDVQPRKRKDKRRKKDADSLGITSDTSFHKLKNEDNRTNEYIGQEKKINLPEGHDSFSRNNCFKVVFFGLLGLLIGTVGLIYLQSLSTKDVQISNVENSGFAGYFAGWLNPTDDSDYKSNSHGNIQNELNENEEKKEVHEGSEKENVMYENKDVNFESVSDVSSSQFSFEENNKSAEENNNENNNFKKSSTQLNSLDDNEEIPEEVVTKLGVGIALIIVAHLVLVKKWKTNGNVTPVETNLTDRTENENLSLEPEPVISRRQTLVPDKIFLNDEFKGDFEEEKEYLKNEYFSLKGNEGDSESEEEEEYEYFEQDHEIINETKLSEEKINKEKENIKNRTHHSKKHNFREAKKIYESDENYAEEECYCDDDYGDLQTANDFVDFKNKSLDLDSEEETTSFPSSDIQKGGAQSTEETFEEGLVKEETQQNRMKSEEPENVERKSIFEENKVGNEEDLLFSEEFKYADELLENNPKAALQIYNKILEKKNVLKALINRARALDQIAELERSNVYLKQATNTYRTVLLQEGHKINNDTFANLADRCISRMRFGGYLGAAVDVHKAVIARFPLDPKHRNALAVTYLMLNQIEAARKTLNETLTLWPENGFALVHYGFIVKTAEKNMEESVRLLMKGIKTEEDGVIDGMFFFHLGDALNRLGRSEEAVAWYDLGVKKGLFLSRYQRSLYNVNRLKGQPWWTKEETTYQDFFKSLELNWKEIRKEGLDLLNSKGINLFKEESENLKDTGDWRQLDLFFRGRKQPNCQKAPITCSLVSSFKPAARCTRGQIKFSVMLPKTHVWPHCGPTNCRLRSHLGLVIPPKTYLRVAEETRSWEEGKFIVFDDSFEHEVWHNGTGLRLVLIVDVWHPELTEHERQSLSPI